MSPLVWLLLTVNFFLFSGQAKIHPRTLESGLVVEVNPQRLYILKRALNWMTFRRNGELMNDTDYEPLFLGTLLHKYRSSKVYRSFVIAFQKAVLPRMILKENDVCNSSYTWMFKDPWNTSVTWHYLKKFTFDMYDKSVYFDLCDYREGLICNPLTYTCSCPEGSAMSVISPQSSVKRCLLYQGEVCSLIDLDHGNDPQHTALGSNLFHMIFNLEKPPSCTVGTQCRFKDNQDRKIRTQTPKCYSIADAPFYPPTPSNGTGAVATWTLQLGSECTLGLYADPGSCEVNNGQYGKLPGLVCYNFGPPRSQIGLGYYVQFNRTGFCAHEYGPYGLAKVSVRYNGQIRFHPFVGAFVHPRSVKLRDDKLLNFYKRLQDELYECLYYLGMEQDEVGGPCSTQSTHTLKTVWDSFMELDAGSAGADYTRMGRDEAKLNKVLGYAADLCADVTLQACKVYHDSYREYPNGPLYDLPAMDCVPTGVSTPGNDGRCEIDLQANNDSLPFSVKFQAFLDHITMITLEQEREEYYLKKEILLANPETECTPGIPPSEDPGQDPDFKLSQTTPLERGHCPAEFVCMENYNDNRFQFTGTCQLKTPRPKKMDYACHAMEDGVEYGACESKYLDEKISQELDKLFQTPSNLSLGQECRYDVEADFRGWFGSGKDKLNKYRILKRLEDEKAAGGFDSGAFCDLTKLLKCKEDNVCGCVANTEPRKVTEPEEVVSDYCYCTTGTCQRDPADVAPVTVTSSERAKLWEHYGDPSKQDLCVEGNLCMYLLRRNKQCKSDPPVPSGGNEDFFVVDSGSHLHANKIIIVCILLVTKIVLVIFHTNA